MTRAHQSEQRRKHQGAAPGTERNQQTAGLPARLYAQIMQLTPGDAESLASLLQTYPGLSGPILHVAAGHMGNAAVQRAISITRADSRSRPGEQPTHRAELPEILDDPPAQAPANQAPASQVPANYHPLSLAELHEILDDPPAQAPASQAPASQAPASQVPANYHPLSLAELHEILDDPPAQAQPARPKPPTEKDSPRMAAARAYNHRHSEFAQEFNGWTNYACLDQHGGGDNIDDGRKLDPELVAAWQERHGLQADGMVGPLTVAKARAVAVKRSDTVAAAPQADARPPV